MRIVNPLYDQAFKYLMDNEAIAKKIVSTILNQEVISLQSKPQETKLLDSKNMVPLSRYDFKAIINTENNEHRNILIEVQKSKYPDPIMRFRRYLAKNYLKEETFIDENGNEVKRALPVVTIYFLGYSLEEYQSAAIKVDNLASDIFTNKSLHKNSPFVQLLTHPSYILQVNRSLPGTNSRIEHLMSLFNQNYKIDSDYVLDISIKNAIGIEEVAEYLHQGIFDEGMIESLIVEKEYKACVKKLENEIVSANKKTAEAEQKEQEAKKKEREAKQREQEAKQKEQEAKKKEQEANIKLAKKMKKYGESIADIINETGLSEDEINKLKH